MLWRWGCHAIATAAQQQITRNTYRAILWIVMDYVLKEIYFDVVLLQMCLKNMLTMDLKVH